MRKNAALKKLLGQVFDAAREGLREDLDDATYQERRREFIFHMSDWLSDLESVRTLFKRPGKADPDEACTLLIGFLYHVVPHLNAAGRLLLDEIRDPFTAAGPRGKNGAANAMTGLLDRPQARKKA